MLDLLHEFLQPLLDFVPRVSRRPQSNEFCVVDGVFSVRTTRSPQLHAPVITHIEYYPACEIPLDLEIQTLSTGTSVEITINATASVVVEDPIALRAVAGSESYLGVAAITIRSEIADIVQNVSISELHEMIATGQFAEQVSESLFTHTRGGLSVSRLAIEDFARTSSFRLYGSSL